MIVFKWLVKCKYFNYFVRVYLENANFHEFKRQITEFF